MKHEDIIKKFIVNCDNFWEEDFKINLDEKHKKNLQTFRDVYKNNISLFVENLINWEGQTDLGVPWQFSKYHYNKFGLFKNFLNFLKSIKRKFNGNEFDKDAFFDDYEILKLTGGIELLKKYPLHNFPLEKNIFFFDKELGISANYRWLRYIYLSNQIIKKNLINNFNVWLDIGSYYGGIQSILKNELPDLKLILCDFNHQLCRSYVNLFHQFPNSKHILPNEAVKLNNLEKVEKGSIIYLPANNLENFSNLKIDLITNFFSFGEMTKSTFLDYFNKIQKSEARYIYLVNRFISGPFFEKTYNTNTNIFDYSLPNYNKVYFDMFPIHHYIKPKRILFGRNSNRPMSSPYFEILLKKI